jgi:osmotically-inducible protein OsmY
MSTKQVSRAYSWVLVVASILPFVIVAGCNTVQAPSQQLSDAQITTQVKTKLASDVSATSVANIHVSTTNGVVTLSGAVENGDIKSRAGSVTKAVAGVTHVNDDLQISPAPVVR